MILDSNVHGDLGESGEACAISALIPTYNRAHLLLRAIESVLEQKCPADEIVIVDDGSTDNTGELLRQYANDIVYIYQENAGSAAARHRGMVAARCQWVALLDSDDIWMPDHLCRMKEAIRATAGRANYYFADTQRTQLEGGMRQWDMTGFATSEANEMIADPTHWLLERRPPMMLQSTVLNRDAYLLSGGFYQPLRYRDDTHLFIKLGLSGPVCAVSGIGAVMTADDNPGNRLSVSHNRVKQGIEMQVLLNRELLDYFGPRLTERQARLLRLRLAKAYLGLARIALQRFDILSMMRSIGLSIMTEPRIFINRIRPSN